MACPSGRLVITECPLLSTSILSDPLGQALDVPLRNAHTQGERLVWGVGNPTANSLYQGEAPTPFFVSQTSTTFSLVEHRKRSTEWPAYPA